MCGVYSQLNGIIIHRGHGEGYAYSFNSPCLPSFMSHASYGYYYYSKYALH